ncbi:hypothetical protein SELMODRAFT_423690 [Selaginella moellendorffii]|uniref:Uncharacterized protein n=1 Tax=Selaginella moellendorffii TaxID=88036 RepID=D8SMK4_SELML|nr:hypothetical protein SELMODRAFT_423690 [Selaginella moellendorffii]
MAEEVSGGLAVKDTDPSRKGKFTRVLGVHCDSGTVIFPEGDVPTSESPSWPVYRNRAILKEAIRATHRLHSVDGGVMAQFGSGVALSPHFLLTSARVAKLSSRCLTGDFVRSQHFSMAERPRYNLETISRDEGCDFALMRVTTSRTEIFGAVPEEAKLLRSFQYFLLPCSPVDKAPCCITSFPGVSSLLVRAAAELLRKNSEGGAEGLWGIYRDAMEAELMEARAVLPQGSQGDIEAFAKKMLFTKLHQAFGNHATGVQTASIGNMLRSSGSELRTTCSTLCGSCGAPVCPIKEYGYFCAWHAGAAPDHLANRANSCDERVFVEAYFQNVLEDLHAPEDGIWKDSDLRPFFQWILKHEQHWCHLKLSGGALRWIEAAKKNLEPPANKKLKS